MFHAETKKMTEKAFEELVSTLVNAENVPAGVWRSLLTLGSDRRSELALLARKVTEENFGKGVFVRALVEISSYCRNNCRYCGLRAANRDAVRYRLTKEQILECCEKGASLGFNTFVLQGGEDVVQTDEWLADVVRAIKELYPLKAVTLSVGERRENGYAMFRSAGADRYLLRHETASEEHYSLLHPASMSAANRKSCLQVLKSLGYQTGSGMMVGSPGQGIDELVADLEFLDLLKPEMIGIGPFIPASGTPFAGEQPGDVEMVLLLISILRLRFPKALIPATTALATLCSDGTERGILAGANVVMPNLTPRAFVGNYTIYDNKKYRDTEAATQLELLEKRLNAIDRHIDYGRGDYNI
ncbi:MAG: [Bacteroidaceae bacterium]|nr:[FeFe] hydrogenase H-cluster radical SAM maturase HydE [Bacteroidaceae bacterium]